MVESVDRKAQIALPAEQRLVDSFLGEPFVFSEFETTSIKAQQCRTLAYREESLKKPPRFRFVAEYHSAIYDTRGMVVHEGMWSDMHDELVRENTRGKLPDEPSATGSYVSANVFTLRAARQVRVIIVDRWCISKEELEALKKQGYAIMDSSYDWIVENPNNPGELVRIPSAIRRTLDERTTKA